MSNCNQSRPAILLIQSFGSIYIEDLFIMRTELLHIITIGGCEVAAAAAALVNWNLNLELLVERRCKYLLL